MGAYEQNLPCLNPNCKSHGRPHPNCRCYGFAEGGAVGHYCDSCKPHQEDCEYFAGGGEVPNQNDIETLPNPKDIEVSSPKSKDLPDQNDIKQVSHGEAVPNQNDIEIASDEPKKEAPKPDDYIEQAKAGAEGIAQGLIGDLAKVAQVKSGMSTLEDINKREKDFPLTHDISKGAAFAGSLLAGPGKAIAATAGSRLLGNVLAMTAYAASDNVSKALLGQEGGDVNSVVAGTILNGGMDGLMNTLTEGLFSAVPKVAKHVFNEKTVRAAENAMIDLAEKPLNKSLMAAEGLLSSYGILSGHTLETIKATGGFELMKKYFGDTIEKVIGKPLTKANAYVGDAILNTLAKTDFFGVPDMIRYAERMSGGLKAVSEPIEALFKSGIHHAAGAARESVEKEIKEWMENGGIDGELQRDQQPVESHAEGGEVGRKSNRSFERLYPAENIMLNQARARVSGYLNTIRPPKNPMKLPFDMSVPDKQKEKAYNKAIALAANPLSIMDHVNSGTLTPDNLTHFKSMWPEAHEHLSKKITERILKAQLSGEKPPYAKRQAMSLFLGSDLDSSFTPQSIAVVQGLYAAKQGGQPQQGPQKKGAPSALAKSSNQYQTDEQSREKRMQNQRA